MRPSKPGLLRFPMTRHGFWVMAAFLFACIPLGPVFAAPADIGTEALTAEALGTLRVEVERTADISSEQKSQAVAQLDQAQTLLEEAHRFDARSLELQERLGEAPRLVRQLRKNQPTEPLELDLATVDPWSNEQLEVVLNERQLTLAAMQSAFTDKDRELTSNLTLARTGGSELATLEKRLSDLSPPAAVESGATEVLTEVEHAWYLARQQELKARIGWLRVLLANLSPLTELAQLDRDASAAQVEAMKLHVSQFRDYVHKRRQDAAKATQQAAQSAVSDAPAAIKALQGDVSRLAAEHADLVARDSEFDQENERVTRLGEEVKRDLDRIQQIVELGGATAQVSALLQKRRGFAPSPKALTQQAILYQQLLSDAALRQLELDEKLRDARDTEAQIERLIGPDAADPNEPGRKALRQSALDAWSGYRDITLDLWKGYTRYIGKLSALEANTRHLLQATKSYREFIDDRLLWMPSTELIPLNEATLLFAGLRWLVDPMHLAKLGQDAIMVLTSKGPGAAIWLLGFIILTWLRKRALHGLEAAAAAAQKVRSDSFNATLRALGDTLILILPLPWLFIGAGLLLGGLRSAHDYTLIIAVGLQAIGHTLLFLGSLRQICRPNGLARVHLLWQPVLCDHLSTQARWLRPLAVPLAFLSSVGAAAVPSAFVQLATMVQTDEAGLLSLGRLASITLMILMMIAIYRVWQKNGPVMQAMAATPDRAKWPSYHILWFGPAMLIPFSLALASLTGFYYTAAFLSAMAGETLWFLILLVLLKDLLLRGLHVTQRRLRFEEALRYRDEINVQRAEVGEQEANVETDNLPLEEDKVNYGQLGDQVSQLVRLGYTIGLLVGLWWIWKDAIPAVSFLDKIELPIATTKLVDGVSKEVPLTLSDMVAGLLLGGLALFAARNIPALLELTLLQRLPLSRASRYAFTTLTQYVVAMIGLVISFKALGLQWSSIQWLVAALSVGLGFGLQEIVANFISGIILLFEQPIRVGDVVTVENTTGTVSRIRIRATTIVNWERQELVIPNKSFITGQLINWTLSDTVNRLLITVGVGYDTDTRKAMELMHEAAEEHPKVLDDPAPRISFEGFGDNSLTLNMRAFLNEVDARLATITELHQSILEKFRAAGIEIAYPQRDLHLSTSRPLEMVLRRDAQAPGGGI
ncbi:MAG: mechanosensitive ion channel domain-containing protein [Sedimenticolaceae bacterium]